MTHFVHRQVAYDVIDRITWALALFCFLLAFVLVTINASKHHEEGGGATSGTGSYTSRAVITVPAPKSHLKTPCVQEAEYLDGLTVQCGRQGR